MKFKILKDDVVGLEFVNITKTVDKYELFVVDEAHHMIDGEDPIWEEIRENHFSKAKQRIILSDLSQNPVRMNAIEVDINFITRRDAKKLLNIKLIDVIRSTKRITMASNLFRKRDEIAKCANDKDGDAVKIFVVKPKNDTEDILDQYVEQTAIALNHAVDKICNRRESFLGLDNRVSIILPDNNDHQHFNNDDFKKKLKAKMDDDEIFEFNIVNAETMFSTFPQFKKRRAPIQLVVDTISNQDGLEYDVAIIVGFERYKIF